MVFAYIFRNAKNQNLNKLIVNGKNGDEQCARLVNDSVHIKYNALCHKPLSNTYVAIPRHSYNYDQNIYTYVYYNVSRYKVSGISPSRIHIRV